MSETKLSKIAIKQLLRVKDMVLAKPEQYIQDVFAQTTACGTACCLAGWVDRLNFSDSAFRNHLKKQTWPYDQLFIASKPWESGCYSFAASAGMILGLTSDQKVRLFGDSSEHWPEQFRGGPLNKPSAEDAAARIDHFIATGGAE